MWAPAHILVRTIPYCARVFARYLLVLSHDCFTRYRMSKAALNAAGVSLAHDLKGDGMSVAILHPGETAEIVVVRGPTTENRPFRLDCAKSHTQNCVFH